MEKLFYVAGAIVGSVAIIGTANAATLTFEGAEYVNNKNVNEITDSTTNTTWTLGSTNGVIGSSLRTFASTAHPASGDTHVRFADANTSHNMYASLALPSPGSAPFNINFDLATSGFVGGGDAGKVIFGTSSTTAVVNSWFAFSPDTYAAGPTFAFLYKSTSASSNPNSTFKPRNANGTSMILTAGEYVNLNFQIDPANFQYTSLTVNGVEQIGNAVTTAYAPTTATPGSVFRLVGGSSTQLTYDLDNISVAAVPEPSALVIGLLAATGLTLRRRRN
ncbi:MAG TPA: hypothetical protein VGN72_12280 [Tepidisphaeraceae bacterium]|jgi:hypothetical protein|nr:hypothetical protein [Tepidisphaeraceae bacterium]